MRRLLVSLIALAILVTPLMVVSAQDPGDGVIIEGNGGTSIGSLLDVNCSGTDCRNITRWLAVGLIGTDPEAQYYAPGGVGVLASDWTVSEDGLTYTFQIRDDLVWSDGTPITAWDWVFTQYAHGSGQTESAYGYVIADLENIEVSEDGSTLTTTWASATCGNLGNHGLSIVPAHVFGWTPEDGEDFDFSTLVDHPYNSEPSVSGGAFSFVEMQEGDRVALERNESYEVPVGPAGYLYVTVPDQTVMAERFIAGELNVADNPQAAKQEEIRNSADLQYMNYAGRSWDYLALNYANPDNPQDGVELDADGVPVRNEDRSWNIVEQEPHPIFGDVRVRNAIQYAINLDEIMEKAVLGAGTVMAANELPTSWAADPDLAPIAQDLDMADALLVEAGWVDNDGDGIRECNGCMYAEEGTPFTFELLTNEGNTRRGQIGELVQDQLSGLGIEVEFTAIDFNQLLDIMDAQEFDAFILGWRNGYPVDPDQAGLFTSDGDVVGSGFNFTSYLNPELDRLMDEANNVAGCTQEGRAELYHEIQSILQKDNPYIWLFVQDGFYAANNSIEGWGPFPNEMYWNVDEWTITD